MSLLDKVIVFWSCITSTILWVKTCKANSHHIFPWCMMQISSVNGVKREMNLFNWIFSSFGWVYSLCLYVMLGNSDHTHLRVWMHSTSSCNVGECLAWKEIFHLQGSRVDKLKIEWNSNEFGPLNCLSSEDVL